MRRRLSPRAAILAGVAVAGAAFAFFAARGLGDATVYYYTPSEVAGETKPDVIRVGGTVVPGSIRYDERAGVVRFALTDGRARVRVANSGVPPDLFSEGREALVEGRLEDGTLRSSEVIVKHDEEYGSRTSRDRTGR